METMEPFSLVKLIILLQKLETLTEICVDLSILWRFILELARVTAVNIFFHLLAFLRQHFLEYLIGCHPLRLLLHEYLTRDEQSYQCLKA